MCIIPKIASYDSLDDQAVAPDVVEFDNGYEQGIRARSVRSRHMTSKNANEDSRECRQAYEDVIFNHCRYPGMTEPCYQNEEEQEENGNTKPINITEKIQSTVRECCHKTCPLDQLEMICCRTSECLKRCYGSKLDIDPDSYKYFDVLSRPHPKSKVHRKP
ncbi:hypothetical protein Ddc_00022 [Ditylenchus destructor]|nr:hypothetical protein Ddc_00022 [Ditylenchus destructor]